MAAAVSSTLQATTSGVPIFAASLSVDRAEAMVHTEMIMVTMPAHDTFAPSSWCMTGQAAPSSESGSPRLIKAR